MLAATSVSEWSSGAPSSERSLAPSPRVPTLLRHHVRPRIPAVAGVLDRLLRGVVGVRGGLGAGRRRRPGPSRVTVVSTDGDRFSPAGLGRAGRCPRACRPWPARPRPRPTWRPRRPSARRASRRSPGPAPPRQGRGHDVARRAERADDQRQGLETTRTPRWRPSSSSWARSAPKPSGTGPRLAERIERGRGPAGDVDRATARVGERRHGRGRAGWPIADEARRRLEERRSARGGPAQDLEVKVAGLVERRAVLSSRLERHRAQTGRQRRGPRAGRRAPHAGSSPAHSATDRLGAAVRSTRRVLGELLEGLRERRSRQVDDVRAGGLRLETLRKQRAEADGRLADDPPAAAAPRAADGRSPPCAVTPPPRLCGASWGASPKRPWRRRAPSCPKARPPLGAPPWWRRSSPRWAR